MGRLRRYDYAAQLWEEVRWGRLDPQLTEAIDMLERDQMQDVYAECK